MVNLKIKTMSLWRRFTKFFVTFLTHEFLSDITVRIVGGIGLALLSLVWIYCFFSFTPTDYLVPLRYNSFMGVTSLGAWYQLYFVPGILLLLFIVNGFLASITYKKDKLLAYILLGTNIFAIVCGAAVVVSITYLVSR
jgi:predicted lysophospholipase L1 biosynthesis ABC-type transport system permease subunit